MTLTRRRSSFGASSSPMSGWPQARQNRAIGGVLLAASSAEAHSLDPAWSCRTVQARVDLKQSASASAGSPGRPSTWRVGPARRDHLAARVEGDSLRPVDVRVAEERGLPAAERVVRDGHRDRHVDPDHARLHLELELPGDAAVAREDRGAVAVGVVVHEPDRLVVRVDARDAEHGPKISSSYAFISGLQVVEQRDAEPEAVALRRRLAAVDDDLAAFVRRARDVRRDLVAVLARDERAHLGVGLHPVADLHVRDARLDRLDEAVRDVADGDDLRDRHAPLARGAVGGGDGGVGGHVDVGVREHDHVVLRSAERLCALAVLRRRLVDVFRDRSRADEGDRLDLRVLEDRVDRDLVAVHDVEDAVGNAGLLQQLGGVHRRGRILLGRLEHERVAARERGRPHPHGHHRGEVERGDAGDDAERLADRVDVDPRRGLLGELALKSSGIPQQYSITSSPRATSPIASESTLPCSAVSSFAMSSRCTWTSSRIRKNNSVRRDSDIARHAGNALLGSLDRQVDLLDRGEVDLRRPAGPSRGCRPGRSGPTSRRPACRRSSVKSA